MRVIHGVAEAGDLRYLITIKGIHGAAEAGDLRYLITIKGIHGAAEAGDLRYLFAKSRWAKGSASFRP